MSTRTANLDLVMPSYNDIVDIAVINSNMDKIDTAIALIRTQVTYSMFNAIYPVGAIYMTVDNTDPATLFGGEWTRIQDCFLLAAGTTYSADTTGGEATHTMTVDEMPAHSHSADDGTSNKQHNFATIVAEQNISGKIELREQVDTSGSGRAVFGTAKGLNEARWDYLGLPRNTAAAGLGQPFNLMPPYYTVYVWKRTALYTPSIEDEESESESEGGEN